MDKNLTIEVYEKPTHGAVPPILLTPLTKTQVIYIIRQKKYPPQPE